MEYEFTVVIERDEDGRFVAVCPTLQGCYTEGETEDEARELIKDAIRLHVEDRLANGEPTRRFAQVRQSGSHVILHHADGRRTTVPVHKGQDLGKGLLRKIMRDAQLTVDDLSRS